MSKKLLAVSFIIPTLLFSGCFNVGDNSTTTDQTQTSDQLKTYNNNQFSFTFPSDWDVIEQKDFTTDIPRETQIVVRNNIKNDTFTANLNVVKNDLQTNQATVDYAQAILNRQKTGLLDYKETKREVTKINIGGQETETYYVEFQARLNQTDPVTDFVQTYGVKDKSGFIIMGSYSTNENSLVTQKVINSVKSFRVN